MADKKEKKPADRITTAAKIDSRMPGARSDEGLVP